MEGQSHAPPPVPVRLYRGQRNNSLRIVDLIVKAAVKDALSEHNVSADFYDALNEEVAEQLEDAARCAEANDRKTVQPRDL